MGTEYAFTFAGAAGWFLGFSAGSLWKLYFHCRYHRSNDDRTESNGHPNRTDSHTGTDSGTVAQRLSGILDADADNLRKSGHRLGNLDTLRRAVTRPARTDAVRRYNFRLSPYRLAPLGGPRRSDAKAVK